jgi:hypothetical protein
MWGKLRSRRKLRGLRWLVEDCRFPSARMKGSRGNRHGRRNSDGFGGGSKSRRDKDGGRVDRLGDRFRKNMGSGRIRDCSLLEPFNL